MMRLLQVAVSRLYCLIFGWPATQRFNTIILHLSLRARGYINHNRAINGEDTFIKTLAKFNPEICVDIGANAGQYASSLLRYTNAKVISFEPNPYVYEKLSALKDQYPDRFESVGKGVADKNGILDFYHPTTERTGYGSFSAEVKEIDIVGKTNTNVTPVEVIKLDDFELPPEIDLIKMDVEGYEYEVLMGMQNIIKTKRVKFIQIEYNLHQLFRNHTLLGLSKLLPGYTPHQIIPHGLSKRDLKAADSQFYHLSNWVFIRSDIRLPH